MRLRLLPVLALLALCAHAQTPPPAASLPDPSALPDMPGRLRMPGADHRECGPSKWSALCPAGRWTQFSHIDLRVTAPAFTARYEIEQADNGEMHTTYRERIGKDTRGGEVVLFGDEGLAYRSRDAFPDPSSILDYTLTSPILMSQLAALLLDLAVLGPPSDVSAPQAIRASSSSQYLRVQAPRKALLFGAPWSATGTVRRVEPDGVGFTLRLRYRPVDTYGNAIPGKTESITLEGRASYAPRRAALPDSMDLAGWKIMRVGEDTERAKVRTLEEARGSMTP